MRVKRNPRFNEELLEIVKYIAKNHPKNARNFFHTMIETVGKLSDSPYKGRPNEDGNRELVFKGYTIPYIIDDDVIVILGIFNQNEWGIKEDLLPYLE
ncbi:MAG: type II toxin-antitoxin system RelE/ParE family toxin [Sulfuricurvum sp.]